VRTNKYVSEYPDYAPALHLWGKYYVAGNYNSKYSDVNSNNWQIGIINQVNAGDTDGTWTQTTRDTIKLTSPMDFVLTTTHTAQDAYARVLDYAGASLHRDTFDELMVSDTRQGKATYTGLNLDSGFINTQDDNKPAGAGSSWTAWPTLNSTTAPADTDGDGIPDEWETANGLDPNKASDGKALTDEGYTNLEVYLNSLVADITDAQYEGGTPQGYIVEEGQEVLEYVIDQQASYDNGTFASGLKVSGFSNTNNPAYGKNATIKFSSNNKYTITIPDGVEIGSVTIYGYGNSDGTSAYLSELGGTQFTPDDYVFPARNANPNFAEYTIQLAAPVTKKLTFTASGTQACLKLTLNLSLAATGINDNLQIINDKSAGEVYNLLGQRISNPKSQIVVANGKKFIKK